MIVDPAPIVERLRSAGCVFAEEEAQLLLAEAVAPAELDQLVRRRCAGEPLEHVLGWARFRGLRLVVTEGVFVPRVRSEFLVECALADLPSGACVLDLCCGCGAVGAAVAAARPDVAVHAADLDPTAVACARRNLPAHSVHLGDLFAAVPNRLRATVEVVVANAPYVPTPALATMPAEARLHEPRTALDGGPDGTSVQRRIIAEAPAWLRPGGRVLIETSPRQADGLTAAAHAAGFAAVVERDAEFEATVLVARLRSAAQS